MRRRFIAFGLFALVLSIALVVGDQSAAGACSCIPQKPELSTFVGRVSAANADSFTFVNVVTASGPPVAEGVVVSILARRPVDESGHQRATSCDVARDQPVVGGVYEVITNAVRPSVSSCVGSFTLVEAPPPQPRVRQAVAVAVDAPGAVAVAVDEDGYRPTVPIVLGGVLLAIGAGVALNRRRARLA